MGCIKILPDSISNRIAAGEVIERPASVVKELVENSIDSGASKIIISVEKAGSKLISVSDDGSGMDSDDSLLCLEPHATSKISHAEDINRIYTLGFRGEALPSIAAVSRLHLRTRRKNSLEGNEVVVEGGRFVSSSPAGCAPGTEIAVRDIFFNTPARKKFLHSDATEERHIQEMCFAFALAYPGIAFELHMDGRNIFSSPPGTLGSRMQSLFGKTAVENMIPAEYSSSGIVIKGYVAKHGCTKNSRREQRIYVNHRPVESPAVYAGIREGYGSLTADGRYPPVVLFMEMDPARVDVNVHPAKREVRFREAKLVCASVSAVVRESLRNSHAPSVSVSGGLNLRSILEGANVSYLLPRAMPPLEELNFSSPKSIPTKNAPSSTPALPDPGAAPAGGEDEISGREGSPSVSSLRIAAFLDETYILASSSDGLVIIDQHAAHERVLFEKILRSSREKVQVFQKLLIPVTVELSRTESLFLEKNKGAFAAVGFEFESFGPNTVLLGSVPADLPQQNIKSIFSDMISLFADEGKMSGRISEADIAAAACKQAVKAHDRLLPEEAENLLRQLSICELPFSCPHGRPTMISVSYAELEKRFGRRK